MYNRSLARCLCLGATATFLLFPDLYAQRRKDSRQVINATPPADTAKPAPSKKTLLQDKVKSSRKDEGLFTLYQDTTNGSVQLYIRKDQLGKEFVYQSFSMNGPNALGLNQSMHRANFIFKVQKFFDKLEFSMVNKNFYYDKQNPVSKAEGVDIAESVFYTEKIAAEDDAGYLVSVDGLFLSDKLDPVKPLMSPTMPPGAAFNLGALNPSKSKYYKINAYPTNTAVLVDLAYDNPVPYNRGGKEITDPRYVRVRMQHTFIAVPENDFRPRRDDPRVGYFMQEVNDQTSISATPFRDMINRWHLVKKDPNAALSEPVEPIVWWVENTTPYEYRQTIVDAGLRWNEAFEKAGFKNAVVMKIMPDTASWDPGDVAYNVIRWVSSPTPTYGAIGPSFVNPRTGQILGADITVEWQSGSNSPVLDELYNAPAPGNALNAEAPPFNGASCTLARGLKAEYMTGLTVAEANGLGEAAIRQMHKEYLYYLILHEMGHTLGLNHNMKSSQLWTPEELNNKALTQEQGMLGSVMDYPAINLASDKSKQGEYYTTRPGPYDLWAIEYGYTPCTAAEEDALLEKILSRSTDPRLAFGNDADDMRAPGKAIDPRVMIYDLSSDAIGYSEERFRLLNNTMGRLKEKYSKPGKSYAELRTRFTTLQQQRTNMIGVVSRYIGGVYVDRSFVGQSAAGKPLTPVPYETQKRAMSVLAKYAFAPDAFKVDESLFAYLQAQRRGFNFFTTTEDPKIGAGYLGMQNGALDHLLHPVTLQRITNTSLYGNKYGMMEMMNDLTRAIFQADMNSSVNVYRRYLQTEYVKKVTGIVESRSFAGAMSGAAPAAAAGYDDVSKGAALYTLKKLRTSLAAAVSPDEDTRAHRTNLLFMIDKALAVK